MKPSMRVLCASLVLAHTPVAFAQDSTGQAQVAGRIASNFTNLAGSESNALALVNALRNGSNATLTYTVTPATTTPPATTPPITPPPPTTPPPTIATVTIDPPTGKMGWGNVKIALGLAQVSLARAGITNPTAEQLQAALNGGEVMVKAPDGTTTTTTLKGVLQMRASGMGWGQIAHSSGTKLGPVVSGLKTNPVKTATVVPASKSVTASSKGIVTAAGVAASPTQGKSAVHSASAPGRGMVTAAGGGATAGVSSATSHGRGAGVVTASGTAATSVTTAQGGNGNGHGNGADKGKGNGRGAGG